MCFCVCPKWDCNELDPTPTESITPKNIPQNKPTNPKYVYPPLPLSRAATTAKNTQIIRKRVMCTKTPDAR